MATDLSVHFEVIENSSPFCSQIVVSVPSWLMKSIVKADRDIGCEAFSECLAAGLCEPFFVLF